MTMKQLKDMAFNLGISPKGTKKALTKAIQEAEGNNPCYGTKVCHAKSCLFWIDCQRLRKVTMEDLKR